LASERLAQLVLVFQLTLPAVGKLLPLMSLVLTTITNQACIKVDIKILVPPSSTDEKITYSKRFIAVYAHIRTTIFSFAKYGCAHGGE
jgi:hypothetical protein